jgi:hypothetical protein
MLSPVMFIDVVDSVSGSAGGSAAWGSAGSSDDVVPSVKWEMLSSRDVDGGGGAATPYTHIHHRWT